MKKFSPRIVWVIAFLVAGLALASAVFFSSRTEPVKADLDAVRQVERAAELALTRPAVSTDPALKLAEFAGFSTDLASLLATPPDWRDQHDARAVEQLASSSNEHGRAGAP